MENQKYNYDTSFVINFGLFAHNGQDLGSVQGTLMKSCVEMSTVAEE
jgi:hypothetical protein